MNRHGVATIVVFVQGVALDMNADDPLNIDGLTGPPQDSDCRLRMNLDRFNDLASAFDIKQKLLSRMILDIEERLDLTFVNENGYLYLEFPTPHDAIIFKLTYLCT